MRSRLATLVASIAISGTLVAACGSPKYNAGAQAQPTSTATATAPTPFPQFLSKTDADAIRNATLDMDLPRTTDYFSTGINTMANITSVQWVRAPISEVNKYFTNVSPSQAFEETADTEVWLFMFQGDFHSTDRTGLGPLGHILYRVIFPNEPAPFEFGAPPIDLSLLGTVNTIQPGQNPGLDTLRAPLSIQVGAPSLVSGEVQVPISAGNPFNASLVPYSGLNVHLRWTPPCSPTAASARPAPCCRRRSA